MSEDRDLTSGSVHVWQCDLTLGVPRDVAALSSVALSPGEHERAAAFAFDEHRRRFLQSRLFLRCLLGSYLGLKPSKVPIVLGANSKPELDTCNPPGFNISHSEDVLLIAISADREVGVDVEVFGSYRNLPALAQSVFTITEQNELPAVDSSQFESSFLKIWTRKEAVLKAKGVGLLLAPELLHVGLSRNGGTRPTTIPWENGEDRWSVDCADIDVGPGRVAAIAVSSGWRNLATFGQDEWSRIFDPLLARSVSQALNRPL